MGKAPVGVRPVASPQARLVAGAADRLAVGVKELHPEEVEIAGGRELCKALGHVHRGRGVEVRGERAARLQRNALDHLVPHCARRAILSDVPATQRGVGLLEHVRVEKQIRRAAGRLARAEVDFAHARPRESEARGGA
eukprot:scaffold24557_cov74-Phaeocystis_antarctica.AAC.1